MIKNTITSLFSVFLILLISFESGSANQQEEKLIKQNREAAKSSTNQAMFVVHRIKCLNANDRSALIACYKALSINPNSGALRNRKVLLSNRLNPKPKKQPIRKVYKAPARPVKQVARKAPAPKKAQVPKKPYSPPSKSVVKTNTPPKVKKVARNDNKKVIIQIQKSLNQLGFNVGRADGVAGKNTRQAIKDFQSLTKNKTRLKLDNNLQLTLQEAIKQHVVADNKYQLAKQHLNEGNFNKSSQLIEKYLKNAPWHKDLSDLNKQLKQQVALAEKNKKNKEISERLAKEKSVQDLALKAQLEAQSNLKRIELMTIVELAQTQFNNKDIESAISTISKGLALNPDNQELISLKNNISSYIDKQTKIDQIVSKSQQTFQDTKFKNSLSLIEEGLTLDPNNPELLALKSKILLKQEKIQTQKEKDETLSILYARALNSFDSNELDSATAFVDKGLSLESKHLKLLELKSKISIRVNELLLQKNKEQRLTDLYNQSLASANNNKLKNALEQIDKGLSIEPRNLKLLELKSEVLGQQKEIESQTREDEKLTSLFMQASDSLLNNRIENALSLVNQGLKLDSKKSNLLLLKREIIQKKNTLAAFKIKSQKLTRMLSIIEKKQKNLDILEKEIRIEQQSLLFNAHQTLKRYHAENIIDKPLSNHSKPAKKNTNTSKVLTPINSTISLESLPLSIGKHWVLDRDKGSNNQCSLSYRKVPMSDGQGVTQVYLTITKDSIVFKTESNIDITYEKTGITIKQRAQVPIEALLDKFSITYIKQYQSLINDMISTNKITLTLGFWPTWPVTQTYSVDFEFDDFQSAQEALVLCNKLENKF